MAGHEVSAPRVTATGAVHAGPCRLRSVRYSGGTVAGTLVFKDGGASGTTVLTLDVKTDFEELVDIPGDGIRIETSLYLTIGTDVATAVVCFIEG